MVSPSIAFADTLVLSNPTVDLFMRDTDNNDICDGGTLQKFDTANVLDTAVFSTPTTSDCDRTAFEWSLTGLIPGDIITNVTLTVDIDSVTNYRNLNVTGLNTQISVASNATIWASYGTGTRFLTNSTLFSTAGDNIVIPLGSSSITMLQTAVNASQSWFSVGLNTYNEVLDGSTHRVRIVSEEGTTPTPPPTLTITYTPNPTPPTTYSGVQPTNLVASSNSATQINLQWTIGAMENINGYKIERETPTGSGWAVIVANTTNTNNYYNNTGLTSNILYNYRIYSLNGTPGISTASNTYQMTTFHLPDAVTDLTGIASDFSTIELSWSAPTSYAPAITGYMINGTTPTGEPVDILNANTGTTATTASALNLLIGQEYSFRVSAITVHGKNATGNIWNGSTIQTFVIGNLTSPDVENTNDFSIFFDRTDLNSSAIQLNVTYPNSYNLSCDFDYKYARTNQTYSGLTTVPDGTDDQTATFVLINATGDLVQVRCWDVTTGDESTYVITITDFPFLQQVNALRNGEYGTFFQIGAFDGVMLIVIFLGMIGLNRTTPIVGIIFVVITTFAMSFFGLITYPVIMYPALILMIVWAFVTTRKDD